MDDTCDEPLFSNINMEAIMEVPTIAKLVALHDNYVPVIGLKIILSWYVWLCQSKIIVFFKLVTEEEEVTKEEIQEEWDFIDACLETKVMDITKDFLVSKGDLVEIQLSFP